MKLWKLTQTKRRGYDTYDSCVVAAETTEEAEKINPSGKGWQEDNSYGSWADKPEQVSAEYLGEAREGMPPGVICTSFNAG